MSACCALSSSLGCPSWPSHCDDHSPDDNVCLFPTSPLRAGWGDQTRHAGCFTHMAPVDGGSADKLQRMQSLGAARLRTTSVDPGAAADMVQAARQSLGAVAELAADKAADAAAGWVTFGEPLTPVPPLAGPGRTEMQPHYS